MDEKFPTEGELRAFLEAQIADNRALQRERDELRGEVEARVTEANERRSETIAMCVLLTAELAETKARLEAAEKVIEYVGMFTRTEQPLSTVYPGDQANLRGLIAAYRALSARDEQKEGGA